MDFYEIDGEKYYFIKGRIYDSSFLEPDITTLRRVAPALFRAAFPSPEDMKQEALIEYIKASKGCGQYDLGILALKKDTYRGDDFCGSCDRIWAPKSLFCRYTADMGGREDVS